ncbi:MAG: 2-C-methyl-D-erythritol 4-phosphate cytidylyltransferase [Moraxellaceae bacterium]|jgi:2-C-methyl-D-erythritol 4-phosphate cytidylyltransferase|nr:2-C-methyl-D-erythritol 4-phosphate cytidylyltransferase [Moraxellaceae bacterium]
MRLWGVVPAAGKGLRVGGDIPKQYLPLAGGTVIQHTLDRLSKLPVEAIVVPVAAGDERAQQLDYRDPSVLRFVTGGAERADSVLAGLEAIAAQAMEDDWVLVHDVARPCVRLADIEGLLRQIGAHPAGGLLANRVRDTMKRGSGDEVAETVPRDNLWHALTPQVFRFGLLRRALLEAQARGIVVTDEAQAVELLGERPLLVEGARDNLKITWPEDLQMAEAFLRLQAENGS